MNEILERIKKNPFLTFDEQLNLMLEMKKQKISKESAGLLVSMKKGAFYKRRKRVQVPRVLLELMNLNARSEKLKKYEELS